MGLREGRRQMRMAATVMRMMKTTNRKMMMKRKRMRMKIWTRTMTNPPKADHVLEVE